MPATLQPSIFALILQELQLAQRLKPGFYLRVENPPYPDLIIEDTQKPAPSIPGGRCICFCHLTQKAGQPTPAPQVVFELGAGWQMVPFYYRHDPAGVEQISKINDEGRLMVFPRLQQMVDELARSWGEELEAQGFLAATQAALYLPAEPQHDGAETA